MALREGSEPRWRRYAEEVLTIVLGVLLALGAGAGRQYFADRRAEREILTALRVEFDADVREISADQTARAQKLAAIELLNAVRAGTVQSPPLDSLATALMRTMDWRYYTPRHPVLDDIFSTGRFDLIRSQDLRRAIMVFQQERARIAVVEEQERNFVARDMQPYLAAQLDLEALSSERSPWQHAAAVRAAPGIVAGRTFGSLLYLARARTESSTGFAARLLGTVSAVQAILGPEE